MKAVLFTPASDLSLHFKARICAKSLLWKSVFIHIGINYYNKSFALRLALKERLWGTRKWPIRIGLLFVRIENSKIKRSKVHWIGNYVWIYSFVQNVQPVCTCKYSAFFHVQTRFFASGESAYTCRFICCRESGERRSRRNCCNRRGEEVEFLNGVSFEEWSKWFWPLKCSRKTQDNRETPNVMGYWMTVFNLCTQVWYWTYIYC